MVDKKKANEKYQEELPKKRKEAIEKDHNQQIDAETLMGFVNELEENDSSSAKLAGDKSAIFKRAEKLGIHKPAFKEALKVHKMDDGTKASYVKARSSYDKILGNFNSKQANFDLDDSLGNKPK